MPFPRREYFTLQRAARRWYVSLDEVQCAIAQGQLAASVWLMPTLVYEVYQNAPDKAVRSAPQPIEGYVRMTPEHCRKVFARGSAGCRKFLSQQEGKYYTVIDEMPRVEILEKELVILTSEVIRFEKAHNIKEPQPCRVISVQKLRVDHSDQQPKPKAYFHHEDGCRYVRLGEREYHFGDIQAAVVHQLVTAAKDGEAWLNGKILLDKAGATSMIMRDVFRHQKHWRELIESNGKGRYRLKPYLSPTQALTEPYHETRSQMA